MYFKWESLSSPVYSYNHLLKTKKQATMILISNLLKINNLMIFGNVKDKSHKCYNYIVEKMIVKKLKI